MLLSLSLALCLSGANAFPAWATSTDLAVSDAHAAVEASKLSLDEATARLNSLQSEYNALSDEIDDMQAQIDELSAQVLDAQDAMLKGRDSLSATAVYEYRNDTSLVMLDAILGARSITELATNLGYISQIMDYQADEIEKQKTLKAELESVAGELTAKKSEQEAKLDELDRKQDEAQAVVNNVAAEYASNTSALAALEAQAAAMKREEAKATQEVNPNATTVNRPDSGATTDTTTQTPPGSQNTSKPSPPSSSGGSSSNNTSNSGNTSSGEGWRTGIATAYGGSSDPNTPNPGTTATGAVCNDSSMGVAVPMAWSNYRSYFGRTVEIKYGGKTVYATVNDCGGMQGGYVSLDLQPGVFKAFGYSTCQAWGARTVQYRFL